MIWVEMVTLRRMGTMGAVRTPPATPSTLPSKMPSQVTGFLRLYQDMRFISYRARDIVALSIAALHCHMCCKPALFPAAMANILLFICTAVIYIVCSFANTLHELPALA